MTPYLLARELHGELVYWTGRTRDDKSLVWSPWRHEGYQFRSAAAAYDCAGTHQKLANSEHWKVVKMTAGCERLSEHNR